MISFSTLYSWIIDNLNYHYQHSPIHFSVEVGMVFFIIYLLSKKSYRPHTEEKLSKAEEEQLIKEWTPLPLVPVRTKAARENLEEIILEGPALAHCKANGKEFINMLTLGVLGMQANTEVIEASAETARKYGVGSCGPRAFYGSLQPHIDFEEAIAKFMGVSAGVLYTSEFQAVATIIPAFLKVGDILIVDKGVCFAFTNGLSLCKCDVIWMDHNDTAHLEKILSGLKSVFEEKKKRVYLAIEGIYANTGELCPLVEILNIKKKYPFRMILEESFSFGVIGKSGRGITEHLGIPPQEIEIIAASVGNALGAMGSFVVGEKEMCDHQRLNATGYVFSCALPPFLSTGATKALELLDQDDGKMMDQLHKVVACVHDEISKIEGLVSLSSKASPYIHLALKNKTGLDKEAQTVILNQIVGACNEKGILFGVSCYSNREKILPDPTLKISVQKDLTLKEASNAISILSQATKKVLNLKK